MGGYDRWAAAAAAAAVGGREKSGYSREQRVEEGEEEGENTDLEARVAACV